MKSMKSRKRKPEKSAGKLSKKSKPVKADEFFDVEAEEGDFIFNFSNFHLKAILKIFLATSENETVDVSSENDSDSDKNNSDSESVDTSE